MLSKILILIIFYSCSPLWLSIVVKCENGNNLVNSANRVIRSNSIVCTFSSDLKSTRFINENVIEYTWTHSRLNFSNIREIVCHSQKPIEVIPVHRQGQENQMIGATEIEYKTVFKNLHLKDAVLHTVRISAKVNLTATPRRRLYNRGYESDTNTKDAETQDAQLIKSQYDETAAKREEFYIIKHYIVRQLYESDCFIALIPTDASEFFCEWIFKTEAIAKLTNSISYNYSGQQYPYKFTNLPHLTNILMNTELIMLPCLVVSPVNGAGIYKGYFFIPQNFIELSFVAPVQENSTYINVDNQTLFWDVVNGFRLNLSARTDLEGFYYCKTYSPMFRDSISKLKITGEFHLRMMPDLQVFPNLSSIFLATYIATEIKLSCTTKGRKNNIVTEWNSTEIVVLSYTYSRKIIMNVTYFVTEINLENITVNSVGRITCVLDDTAYNDTRLHLHTWSLYVSDLGFRNNQHYDACRETFPRFEHTLILDRSGNESICLTDFIYKEYSNHFMNIACNDPMECHRLKKCFWESNIGDCKNLIKTGHFYKAKRNCKSFKPAKHGMILCQPTFELEPITYFTGFDDRIYLKWEEAPLTSILELYSDTETFYTDERFSFSCKLHSFLSSGPAVWIIGLENSSLLVQHQANDTWKEESSPINNIGINFETTDIRYIACAALVWKSNSQWVDSKYYVDVKESRPPKILSDNFNPLFEIGEVNQVLACKVDAYPPVDSIQFYTQNETQEELISNRNFSVLEQTNSLSLIFPEFTHDLEGEYFCFSNNVAGNDTKSFVVAATIPRNWTWIIIAVVAISLIMFMIFFAYGKAYYDLRRAKKVLSQLTEEEIEEFLHGVSSKDNDVPDSIPYDRTFDIPKDLLHIDTTIMLGSGEFGFVYKATVDGRDVAVKTTKPNSPVEYLKALLSELKILIFVGKHPNIIELIGAHVEEIGAGTLYIVTELSNFGSLEQYLTKCRINTDVQQMDETYVTETSFGGTENPHQIQENCQANFMQWAWDISNAMDFLVSKKVVHSDLAARNVLLFEYKRAKISDFGLSRKLLAYEYVKETQEPLPWRYLSIEALEHMTFSSYSDVWAFGLVLWEMYSFAKIPYPGISLDTEFISKLKNGMRPLKPDLATDDMYALMLKCWSENPTDRPTFSDMKKKFKDELYSVVV